MVGEHDGGGVGWVFVGVGQEGGVAGVGQGVGEGYGHVLKNKWVTDARKDEE